AVRYGLSARGRSRMTRSTNMEHVEVLWAMLRKCVHERPARNSAEPEANALHAAIAALSAPAEAQAQGDGELWHMVAKLAAHVRPTCGELWAEAERLLNRAAPPSAPVGVEAEPKPEARGVVDEGSRSVT